MRYLKLASLLVVFAISCGLSGLRAGNFSSGSQTCPGSGNKRVSSTSLKAVSWTMMAPGANTGYIAFGGSAVTTTTGPVLYALDSYTANPAGNSAMWDLSQVYIACSASGDKVVYTYVQ